MTKFPSVDLDEDRLLPDVRLRSDHWQKWRRSVLWVAVSVLALSTLWFGVDQWRYLRMVNPPGDPEAATVYEIKEGTDLEALSEGLAQAGFVVDAGTFRRYVREEGGLDVTPGFYTMRPRDHMGNLLRVLRTPPNETYFKVTFPEGFTAKQIFARVAKELGSLTTEALSTAAGLDGSPSVVRSEFQPEGINSLEGLLFPDTYFIAGDSSPTQVLRDMVSLMDRVAKQEGITQSPALVGRSPYEVLIIASIIEREAKLDEDRDLIARVIYNRLELGMNLEIDATLFYGQDPDASVSDLKQIDSPYNTYKYPGLPPTPIANPGRESIAAALDPAPNPVPGDPRCVDIPTGETCRLFYYVLADEDGRHVFAVTEEQHLQNVQKAIQAGIL